MTRSAVIIPISVFLSRTSATCDAGTVYLPPECAIGIPGPAKEFRVVDTDATIGFISTMSEPFCEECNRLRLNADGKLQNCLFASEDIGMKQLLRTAAPRAEIEQVIHSALNQKRFHRPTAEQLLTTKSRSMMAVGGQSCAVVLRPPA